VRIKLPPVKSMLGSFAKKPEPESEKSCSMASGNEGDNGLWMAEDICVGGGTGIDPETGVRDSRYASVANTVVLGA